MSQPHLTMMVFDLGTLGSEQASMVPEIGLKSLQGSIVSCCAVRKLKIVSI
jgi:hypothetical protein